MAEREFDIILWGCTGFTGKITAAVLARRYGVQNPNLRVALAGRNHSRLEAVAHLMLDEALKSDAMAVREDASRIRKSLGEGKEILPLIELRDISRGAQSLCERTYVIIALAGPFSECGEPVVQAAAKSGTDYVDITGELPWVKSMQEKYNSTAKQNKAKIIPCCGFDYILNDVGVFCVQDFARQQGARPVREIEQVFVVKGSQSSGGTLRSVFRGLEQKPLMQVIFGGSFDPFQLCNDKPDALTKHRNATKSGWRFSSLARCWTAPNMMSPSMRQYIHWTNEIQGYPYGKDFVFKVAEKSDGFIRAVLGTVRLAFVGFGMAVASKIGCCRRRLAPPSGEGRPMSELEGNGNFVQVQTVGVVHRKNANSLKVDHTITFLKGDAYMMTAWTVLEAGMACLDTRRGKYPSTNQYGVGCASELLGPSMVTQLKLAGFNSVCEETAYSDENN